MVNVNELVAAEIGASSIDGAAVLDSVHEFIGRFVAYPSEDARVAHALWIAHTWLMDRWDSTPRIAFLSPEPGSGKSRALEVTEPLVPGAIQTVNASSAYLFRKVSDDEVPTTFLVDESDTIFTGPKAKEHEDLRGMINAGHRRGATAGRCVQVGRNHEPVEYPAYCAIALAGLNDLPETIMTRSVVVRMRRRAPNERIEPWRMRKNGAEAAPIARDLELWAATVPAIESWPEMPDGVEDRNADVWEALIVVADLAGGDWPKRARSAAVAMVAASADRTLSLGILLLTDLRSIFGDDDRLPTETVIEKLIALPESPWRDLPRGDYSSGKSIDARSLSSRLRNYGIKSKVIRIGARVIRGYERSDFVDTWSRYLPQTPTLETPSPENSVTSVTPATTPKNQAENVTDKFDVTLHSDDPLQEHVDKCGTVTDVTGVTHLSGIGKGNGTKPLPAGLAYCRTCNEAATVSNAGLCLFCDQERAEREAIQAEAAA